MSYVVFARKYRPTKFDEVVGQQHVSQTLKKALQTDHLAHAFLFCGPRGVGKTTCARILARVLNCRNVSKDFEPCGECDSCKSFSENASFNIFELDGASNNQVDHMRALVEQVRFQPQQGKFKVYIIDEVHMLSASAFNAFLKTLEEPPPHVIFILATTEKHKILPTILSRCQTYDFKRIQVQDMVDHLADICQKEGIKADKDALHIIGQKADGSLRDALSLFDRIVALKGDSISYEDVITNLNVLDYDYYFRFVEALLVQDLPKIMLLFDEVLKNGFEGDWFITGLAEHFRNLLLCREEQTKHLLEVSETLRDRYHNQAILTPPHLMLSAIGIINECDVNYKTARNKRIHVEMALIRICFIQQAVELAVNPSADSERRALEQKKKPELKSIASENNAARVLESNKEKRTQLAEVVSLEPEIAENENASLKDEALQLNEEVVVYESSESEQNGFSGLSSIPSLQSLDIIHEEAAVELGNSGASKHISIDQEKTQEAWNAYIESIDRNSVRMILKSASLKINGDKIKVEVGTTLAENTIRQESEIIPFLCDYLGVTRITMEIGIDPSKSPVVEAPPKPMTDSEKYWKMKTQNPLIDDFRKKLDLRLDSE